jgi:hypothetical protein
MVSLSPLFTEMVRADWIPPTVDTQNVPANADDVATVAIRLNIGSTSFRHIAMLLCAVQRPSARNRRARITTILGSHLDASDAWPDTCSALQDLFLSFPKLD